LLLHFDGDNNSTIFTDDSSNNFLTVPSGGVVISTEQSKFGGASAYFSGGTSRISIPVGLSDAFNLGPDDFTIAFWINPSSIPSYYSTLISGDDSGGYDIPFISLWPNGIIRVGSRAQADPELETSTNNITASSWHHIAVTKDKGTLRIFIDGMISGTHSNSTISYNFGFGGQVNIGLWGLEDTPYSGYMDDLVVIKGTSLYNSTFTPPTAPFLPGGSFNIAVR
jgi:hypothetical protein